ncbi:DUF5672 family protein [Mucilaginibacter jinjuensis]|uniref:DUF5672 family protein n=1 Tax=Mucilaginibacter jinjuensis TaxID=1176721 RepID=A0ABY7T711_9SPHI|nr:DUF5672 family protein [Mucilaginibacter jinjuensis]WCT11905.1 DUF5672 family protein [Mucilaginibacter jinjuensis]
MLKQVAVVIPFYRDTIPAYEQVALQQCERILSAYPKIAVKPVSLTLPDTAGIITFADTISFNDDYFKSIAGYNRLMLSAEFYERFSDYEYLLIYQADAFVFRDELGHWCSQDWDYIGAPWIRKSEVKNPVKSLILKIQQELSTSFNLKKDGVPNKYQFENKVGNGGLSLRRVKKFYEVCIAMQPQIEAYLAETAHQYNEDAFWSIEVNRKKKFLNIPGWKTGLKFAFETYPQHAYYLNGQQLPFGCHDWDRYADYWRPVFKSFGYEI